MYCKITLVWLDSSLSPAMTATSHGHITTYHSHDSLQAMATPCHTTQSWQATNHGHITTYYSHDRLLQAIATSQHTCNINLISTYIYQLWWPESIISWSCGLIFVVSPLSLSHISSLWSHSCMVLWSYGLGIMVLWLFSYVLVFILAMTISRHKYKFIWL